MYQKNILRKKYFNLRKKNYYEIKKEFFSPLLTLIKSNFKKEDLKLALYYPASFEINVLKLFENEYMIDKNVSLPVIEENNKMSFFPCKKIHFIIFPNNWE